MASVITTSLVVDFAPSAGDAGSLLIAEVDAFLASEGGLNGGDTSFSPGDSPGYLLYFTADVTILTHLASLGLITSLGTRVVNVTEFITFQDTNESSLSKPSIGAPAIIWVGNNLGATTMNANRTKVIAATKGVAVAQAVYTATAHQFRLNNIPTVVSGLTEYEVLIFIAGETP